MRLARAVMLFVTAALTAAVACTIAQRIGYPYDLEWLEGSTLCHALRLLQHQPIYAAPSVDFVPHPYTPLYPLILAVLAHAWGLGYWQARVVSLASFAGALLLGWRFLRRENVPRAPALAALALPIAAYAPLGSWWDLARVDGVWLLLTAAALTTLWHGRASARGVVPAALLLVAAFFAKQTAAPFMLVATLALLKIAPRRVPLFVATLALAGLPLLFWLQHASDGWFWFYVSKLHRAHYFSSLLVLSGLGAMTLLCLPAWALVGWALAIARHDRDVSGLRYSAFVAAGAIAISALAHGTAGAYLNAYLPAIYFSALAAGLAAARLIARGYPRASYAGMTVALVCAAGLVPAIGNRLAPPDDAQYRLGYDLRRFVPSATARRQGDALIARLRATPGDVWVASHPFYAHLAGKRTFVSEMALTDLAATGMRIRGLADAPFVALVLDEPAERDTPEMISLCSRFPRSERLDGPDSAAGVKSVAQWRTPAP